MAYIIDTYNKFNQWDRDHKVSLKLIGDIWSAIYWVEIGPDMQPRVDWDKEGCYYYVYQRLDEAVEYLERLRGLR